MKKRLLSFSLAAFMLIAFAAPAMAAAKPVAPENPVFGDVIKVDKKAFDAFEAPKMPANNNVVGLDGGNLISDSKAGWFITVTGDTTGTLAVAYKISSEYFIVTFDVDGVGDYWIGDGSGKNGVNMVKVGVFEPTTRTIEVVVNLGFIGYYLFNDTVLSTSIHWQYLEQDGDMIDWDAVDAAYDAWVAQGGLVPARDLWQTSGYASFTFEDYAAKGYGDFTEGQIEGYYLAYYLDPGYTEVSFLGNDITAYYAVCQLWNDLVWKNDGFGLTEVYTLTVEERDVVMMPVGIAHREALQAFWGTDEMDVRYIPVSWGEDSFYTEWTIRIRASMEDACDRLGIDIDAFIANYDTDGFLTRNNLW